MKRILIAALGLLVVTGCVKKINMAGARATQPGVMSSWMNWVKDKGSKFDAEWNVMNEGNQPVVIMSDDVACSRGSTPGRITNGPFSRSNVSVSLNPGQKKTFLILCSLGGSGGGDFRMSVTKLYSQNQSGLKGDLIAENMHLVVGPNGQLRSDGGPAPTPLAKSTGSGSNSGIGGSSGIGNLGGAFSMSSGTGKSGGSSSSSSSPPPVSSPPPAAAHAPLPPAARPPRALGGGRTDWPAAAKHPEWVLAIMEVEDVNAHRRGKAIDKDLVRNIGDQLRIFVAERGIQTVDKSAQEAALKESIAEMKSASYGACYDDSCQVELGKALAATHILRSKITRFGSKCVLNGELIDLRAEVAVAAASSRGDCIAEGFLNMSEEVAVSITAQ